jgi:hypothetical protein
MEKYLNKYQDRDKLLSCLEDSEFQGFLEESEIKKTRDEDTKSVLTISRAMANREMVRVHEYLSSRRGELVSRYQIAKECYGYCGESDLAALTDLLKGSTLGVGLGIEYFRIKSTPGIYLLYKLWYAKEKGVHIRSLARGIYGEYYLSDPDNARALVRTVVHGLNKQRDQLQGTRATIVNIGAHQSARYFLDNLLAKAA